ncbi:39S ribosomal protein L37, mitochondrial-like [Homarus americanus]|uniref:39S ribosomal protein L37-like n=1 Tax=Homarus americanus TaxID=6706 RepID=A0A8J5K8S4_HOMAM|nr:39S ribosomal protein L37, mitochondrial-like [Homarus americanus]KAG7166824.1 39S ribosomal protein L37-like [Homarus americanus]
MRVTELRFAQNIGSHFKALWLIQGKKRVSDTGAAAILRAKGVPVVHPQEVLSPAYDRPFEKVDLLPRLEPVKELEEKQTLCHVFTNKFSPVMGVSQVQLITNSVVRSGLPETVLERAVENTAEEDEKVKEAILHAYLLDSKQIKLTRVLDVINRPGWIYKREYGIPVARRHKTLTYQLLLLLDHLVPGAAERQLVEDTITTANFNHSDRLIQTKHRAAFILSSPNPLPQLLDNEEVKSLEEETMPDIYPLSPFINCRAIGNYSLEDSYGVGSGHLHPHTIFIHHNQSRMPHSEEHFNGMTLLYAFSHAAAYAKQIAKIENGNLEKPVVVQVVHMHKQHFHMGVFQLNTLNLTGLSKNIFWTQPWEPLFGKCCFQAAKPVLEGYNPKVFSLLKGLHAQC